MARLFEAENDQREKENKVIGIITSVAFHAMLIGLFYFLTGVKLFDPPLGTQGGGVMINLGVLDDGMGEVQPTGPDNQAISPEAKSSASPPPVKSAEEKLITNEKSEAPAITKKDPKKNTKKDVQKTVVKTPNLPVAKNPTPTPKPKSLYTGGAQNNSTGEGDGKTPGDKGQTNGTPDGNAYKGTPGEGGGENGPSGPGHKYVLKGRKLLHEPCINDNSQETGTIVLKIKVDKTGKVIAAEGPAPGSTTTSTYLLNLAKKGLVQCCRFDAPSGVANEQFGTYTIQFKVK